MRDNAKTLFVIFFSSESENITFSSHLIRSRESMKLVLIYTTESVSSTWVDQDTRGPGMKTTSPYVLIQPGFPDPPLLTVTHGNKSTG